MTRLFFAAASLLAFASCSGPDKILQDRLTQVDSVAINFFSGDGSMDTVVGVTILRDRKEIDSLVKEAAQASIQVDKPCAPQASMHFFSRGQVIQDLEVGIAGCDHLSYLHQGKRRTTSIGQSLQNRLINWRAALKR